jgi:hypothetical protein
MDSAFENSNGNARYEILSRLVGLIYLIALLPLLFQDPTTYRSEWIGAGT